jgi:hypothetical protein
MATEEEIAEVRRLQREVLEEWIEVIGPKKFARYMTTHLTMREISRLFDALRLGEGND